MQSHADYQAFEFWGLSRQEMRTFLGKEQGRIAALA